MAKENIVSKIISFMPKAIAELQAAENFEAAGLLRANQLLLEAYFRPSDKGDESLDRVTALQPS
ncbi:hypothetical protein [Acidocella sp. MX-AZ02]|uniref:hypothetical protein n=1 Tax=Acidocella sp. MX-AZ02 TaxID=1214225 RepID=UPI001969E616|nr:hypothetical protein [Acidocella sp. MX-AZ02]